MSDTANSLAAQSQQHLRHDCERTRIQGSPNRLPAPRPPLRGSGTESQGSLASFQVLAAKRPPSGGPYLSYIVQQLKAAWRPARAGVSHACAARVRPETYYRPDRLRSARRRRSRVPPKADGHLTLLGSSPRRFLCSAPHRRIALALAKYGQGVVVDLVLDRSAGPQL